MRRLFCLTEWESSSGWHCGDVSDLGHMSNAWWYPMRALQMTVEEYIPFLVECGAFGFSYSQESNVLLFRWKNQSSMRKFKNKVNKAARENHFFI